MSSIANILERVQFFNGQQLFASDLQAIDDLNRQMRELHNRSLHQAGVASGYAVAGQKGDRQITVQPGYAIDSYGREIVLTETSTQPVPPVANDGQGNPVLYDLTVAYPDTLPTSETRATVCCTVQGTVRLSEAPVFCWVRADASGPQDLIQQIEQGLRLRLARAEILNCQLNKPITIAQRTNAKPSCQPYLAADVGPAAWDIKKNLPFGITLTPKGTGRIDTSASGFRTVPGYFAAIRGNRTLTLDDASTVYIDGFVGISDSKEASFAASVLIPALLFAGQSSFTPIFAEIGFVAGNSLSDTIDRVIKALNDPAKSGFDWRLEWMGVEI